MIPGTVDTATAGRSAATPSATEENVLYTLGSPRVTKATRWPWSKWATTRATTATSAALRASVSTSMTKTTRSICASDATLWTTASARPTDNSDVLGASTTSALSSTCTARRVTRDGSPGPTPTPISAGPSAGQTAL